MNNGANAGSYSDLVNNPEYLTIRNVKTTIEPDAMDLMTSNSSAAGPRVSDTGDIASGLDEANVELDQIINMGTKIWKIIEANKPVVNLNFVAASALPKGVTDWQDMQGWQAPMSQIVHMTYTNGFNMNVVDFAYRIIFTYGGSVNGKGKYITQMQVMPANLSVAWGYTFEASADANTITNAGTSANPVAALQALVSWRVKTVIKDMQSTNSYYMRGDGLFQELSNGNLN